MTGNMSFIASLGKVFFVAMLGAGAVVVWQHDAANRDSTLHATPISLEIPLTTYSQVHIPKLQRMGPEQYHLNFTSGSPSVEPSRQAATAATKTTIPTTSLSKSSPSELLAAEEAAGPNVDAGRRLGRRDRIRRVRTKSNTQPVDALGDPFASENRESTALATSMAMPPVTPATPRRNAGWARPAEASSEVSPAAFTAPTLPDLPPVVGPGWAGTCPGTHPKSGALRVVSDITKEGAHVELVSDTHIPQRFNKPPQPIMSSQAKLAELCPKYGWRFCPNPKRGQEDHDWYTCEARQFVGKVHCAYIDNQGTIPGMVYDHGRTYPVHGCHPHKLQFQPQPLGGKKVVALDKVAHNLAVYPTGFAHVMAQLPRLILLLQSIPKDVPILLAPSKGRDQFVQLLHDKGVLDKKRILTWNANTVYHANTVYYAGEMGRGAGTRGMWDTLKKEYCSWALVMPRKRLQKLFAKNRTAAEITRPGSPVHMLVVHRKDASGNRRMIKNHASLLGALRTAFPSPVAITEFVGAQHSMKESIELFARSDVVVAPHGAALGFLAFMRPGAACVEVGYKELKGMRFPAPYFMALALSVDVAYFLSMAEGGYGSQLTADVSDVVAVTRKAVAYATTPGARFPNLA
mmetsp:Transcript_63609/g.143487  ORF Transcript_63609/g.143487 Transcript_63609/m.143487 type:complete len:631 (-) Transcript_63609:270-2162(-)